MGQANREADRADDAVDMSGGSWASDEVVPDPRSPDPLHVKEIGVLVANR